MIKLTASRATPFLALMYTVFVDKLENPMRKSDDETQMEISRLAKEVLPEWGPHVPALKDILLEIMAGKNKAENYQKLGLIIKNLMPGAKQDHDVPQQEIELLSALGAYFRTDSQSMAQKLIKFASLSKSAFVTQRLAPTVGDQHSTKQELAALLMQLVGRADTALTPDEAKHVKELKPDAYAQYLELRKAFNQSWKDATVAFIRKSGKHLVPFNELNEYLQLNGIDHMMAVGFTGLVDDLGRWYTSKGQLINGVPNAVSFPAVRMNPAYGTAEGGDWVFMALRPDGSAGPYFYTTEFQRKQSAAKFKKVGDLAGKIKSMRNKWMSKVRDFKTSDPQAVAATVLEILYEFAARVGGVGNAAHGSSTYGVSTLLVKHATILPNGNITLRYKGKDGVPTTHKITKTTPAGKFLIENLNELMIDKQPNDRLFTTLRGGKQLPITPQLVNTYFKACGAPEGVTVHKLRTLAGTTIFNDEMGKALDGSKPGNEKQAMTLFMKLAEAVGKKLNHVRNGDTGTKVTGATALQAYIDVAMQLLYWSTVGFRPPKFLEQHAHAMMEGK